MADGQGGGPLVGSADNYHVCTVLRTYRADSLAKGGERSLHIKCLDMGAVGVEIGNPARLCPITFPLLWNVAERFIGTYVLTYGASRHREFICPPPQSCTQIRAHRAEKRWAKWEKGIM
jgi:hypothetical protein